MSDELQEALAKVYSGADWTDEEFDALVAAARNWQQLSDPSDELVLRIAKVLALRADDAWAKLPPVAKRNYANQAWGVLDALAVSPKADQ